MVENLTVSESNAGWVMSYRNNNNGVDKVLQWNKNFLFSYKVVLLPLCRIQTDTYIKLRINVNLVYLEKTNVKRND